MYRILATITTRQAATVNGPSTTSTTLDIYAVQRSHRDGSPAMVSTVYMLTDGTYEVSPVRKWSLETVGAVVGDYQLTSDALDALAARVAATDYGRSLAARLDYVATIPVGNAIDALDAHARTALFAA